MNTTQYQIEHNNLMSEWETEARNWMLQLGKEELSYQIPFFRDGVTCPEVWFDDNNTFRPLFVLKEVSIGKNNTEDVPEFLKIWGNKKTFEFAQYDFDDIKIGTFRQWKRIARLAKALEDVHNGIYPCDYGKYDFSFQNSGKFYEGDIPGYTDKMYCEKTANSTYNNIISKIAVLELKKVGAGQSVTSDLSIATGYYTDHIDKFKDKIIKQIQFMKPTVIIGLGRENGECITKLLVKNGICKDTELLIEGYHHARTSNEDFYNDPLEKYWKSHLR